LAVAITIPFAPRHRAEIGAGRASVGKFKVKIVYLPTLAFWCWSAGPEVDIIKRRGVVVHLIVMRPCSNNRAT